MVDKKYTIDSSVELSNTSIEKPKVFKDDIAAITCFFNPAGFKKNLENYQQFKKYMREIGCPLYSIELAFGDRPFELEPDEMTWQIRTKDVMWHKERLLNLVEKKVPSRYTKIIWTDSDLTWDDMPDWFKQTSHLLDIYKVVQPFSKAFYRTENGAIEFVKSGLVTVSKETENFWDFSSNHPGFVWAIRREFFSKFGLYDRPFWGSSDAFMAYALLGKPDEVHTLYTRVFSFQPELINDFLEWARPVADWVSGGVTDLPTTINHHWHGARHNRYYYTKMKLLKNFKPKRDLIEDSNGVYNWSENVDPELKDAFATYFSERKEDRIIPKPTTTGIVTSVTRDYFKLLPWWLKAVRESEPTLPIFVVAIWLDKSQLEWLEKNNIPYKLVQAHFFDDTARHKLLKNITNTNNLCCWIKPFMLQHSPFDNTIWIDVDALILKPITELTTGVQNSPLFFRDTFNPKEAPNNPKLYQLLPVPGFDPSLVINNGVFAINLERDHVLYDWWIHCCYNAFLDPKVLEAVVCWDQGALLWALHKSQMQHLVLESSELNCPANFVTFTNLEGRINYSRNRNNFLEKLREHHAGVSIAHWMGPNKLGLWPDWIEDAK